ncbi:histone acetyltransferase HAC12-like [Pistacia vera]|uniref:histone acetyltransferase HAC12-like n=1 Tax=Pistacia vera TaxID=55513 RepID=UPI001263715D|nr:histone acetyltransferase HAC12-like [Pistacia vera]
MTMSTFGLKHDCCLDRPNNRLSHLKGRPFNGYETGAASLFTDVHQKNISSPMGMKQIGEMIRSPQQASTSTVTTCSSRDGFSLVGSFDSEQVHDSNLQIPHLLEMIPKVSNTLPSLDMDYHQPYVQFDKPDEAKEQCYISEKVESGNSTAAEIHCRKTILPSGQSHRFPAASENSAPFSSSKGLTKHAPSNNLLCFSLQHKILCTYINYKSSMVPTGDCQVSFVNYLHSTICDAHMCRCERFYLLLSHFDDCHSFECYVCGPVRHLCGTGKLHHEFNNTKRNFNDIDSGGPNSGRMDCMERPSKHLKTEKKVCPISHEIEFSSFWDPLKVQPFYSGALPPLQQWPESPISINSEVREVDRELLRNTVQNSIIDGENGKDVAGNWCRLNAQSVITPKEHIVGSKMKEVDLSCVNEIAQTDSSEVSFSTESVLGEELSTHCKEDVPIWTLNQNEAEIGDEHVAPKNDCGTQLKSKNPRIKGISLIEFFTAEQIRGHISSLRQWNSQTISKEGRENKIIHKDNGSPCQLCGIEKFFLAPTPMYCSYCGGRIKNNMIYYSAPEENGMRHCFCTACYRECRGGSITLYGIAIAKTELVRKRNYEETEESWVQCDNCQGWQHQICALFNNKRDMKGEAEYMCPKCCLEKIETDDCLPLPKNTFFGAKDLPCTMLSDHIEQRLFKRLHQEREKKAKLTGKNLDEVPRAEDLAVRVVLSVDKLLKAKPKFLEIFQDENYPTEFPYRSKVILLFQTIDGVDICLFSMYVQEYGSECGYPNQRCVYISYLDSVKYFRPETQTSTGESLRTFVYHEILIGYLEYCKKRGFGTCYIWACPPVKGEDYILYCHPETQKTPKSDKLRQWYKSMLRKAVEEKIVVDSTNLYDYFFVPTRRYNSKVTAAHLPYFDGDYWSGAAEGVIKSFELGSGRDAHKKVKKPMAKRTLKAMGHTNPSSGATKDILLMQKLGQAILPVKEDFIIVHLQFVCTHCHKVILHGCRWFCNQCKSFQLCERCHDVERNLNGQDVHVLNSRETHLLSKVIVDNVPPDTNDRDVILDNSLFDNRSDFLSFCQRNSYQFDSLRRAKHSSMMILYHLHNPNMHIPEGFCSFCDKDTYMDHCWFCEICPQFEVCAACYQEKGASLHIHKLRQRSCAANSGTLSKEISQGKEPTIQSTRLLDVLRHASICNATKSQPCSFPNCLEIKMLFIHACKCRVRATGGCWYCKKAWLTLKLHSSNCKESNCSVPRCKDLKKHVERLTQQNLRFLTSSGAEVSEPLKQKAGLGC